MIKKSYISQTIFFTNIKDPHSAVKNDGIAWFEVSSRWMESSIDIFEKNTSCTINDFETYSKIAESMIKIKKAHNGISFLAYNPKYNQGTLKLFCNFHSIGF